MNVVTCTWKTAAAATATVAPVLRTLRRVFIAFLHGRLVGFG
jgi:hypothetical protein